MKTTLTAALLASVLALGVSAPAFAYGSRSFDEMAQQRDVGREAFHSGAGTPLAMRPAAPSREQMPTGLTGWRHDGSNQVSNGQAAYPVLTQTAMDHPPTGVSQGTTLTERFPDRTVPAASVAGGNDLAFEG